MIVLDAAVLIAYLESTDVHHQSAVDLLVERAGEDLLISPINRAEVLVGPARAGRMGDAADAFARIGLRDVPLDEDAPVRLAELRASTALTLPDCCALLAAQQTGRDAGHLRRPAQAGGDRLRRGRRPRVTHPPIADLLSAARRSLRHRGGAGWFPRRREPPWPVWTIA